MFIYFWGRKKQSAKGGEAERETQNLKQIPGSELSAQSLTWGSNPWTFREIMAWAKVGCLMDWTTQALLIIIHIDKLGIMQGVYPTG